MEIVLKILFLTFSDANIQFAEKKLILRSYTTAKALPITKKVELIYKKKFVAATIDENSEMFVMHVVVLEAKLSMLMYSTKKAQILVFQTDKTPTKVSAKYLEYTNIFTFNLAIELSENISIYKYVIKLIDNKQLLYRFIYILSLIKLEILKTYIEIYLKTRFIQLFESLADAFILFDKKPNGKLQWCINS